MIAQPPVGTIDPGSAAVFANEINYTADAFWRSTGTTSFASLDTASGSNSDSGSVTGAVSGAMRVSVTVDSSPTTVVVAGTYQDILTISFEALP